MTTTQTTPRYNGWANYETWSIKLWIDNDHATYDYWRTEAGRIDKEPTYHNEFMDLAARKTHELATMLKNTYENWAEEWMPTQAGPFSDLFHSALGRIEWYEIAQALLEEVQS